ncbi:hypothetical protein NBRC111894_4236 [Sporolactobacillus inulinus]|uniref:Phosphoglycerate mutase family n=1 Tax=Sporolactobacillus inulinus TaxID=2078 RepID=A0A4Y1ZHL2_9BACL|nr:hypothetical protein NBRC111894_4236 [Sporolactobacillus inulinus]
MPDTTFQCSGPEHFLELMKEVNRFEGEHNASCKFAWESYSVVKRRVADVLKKYSDYNFIVVVTHGIVIRQFVTRGRIPYSCLLEKTSKISNLQQLNRHNSNESMKITMNKSQQQYMKGDRENVFQ